MVLLHSFDITHRPTSLLNRKLLKDPAYLAASDHRELTELIVTIDPPSTDDMEDALSIEVLGHDSYEIGVHIVDATSYAHLINRQQIVERGTSTYLPHQTIHMMPPELVAHLSFTQHKRRLAFSVFMKVDSQGTISAVRFEKSIIRNNAQLTYEEAQTVLDGEGDSSHLLAAKGIRPEYFTDIKEKLQLLKSIALTRRRLRNHSDLFDRNEVVFELDSDNLPVNIGVKKRLETEKMVEELMIMTNGQVAQRLVSDLGVDALLIHQPRPLQGSLSELNHYISDLGVKFKYQDIQRLPQEFEQFFQE